MLLLLLLLSLLLLLLLSLLLVRWGKDRDRWMAPRRFYLKLHGTIWDVTEFARCMVRGAHLHALHCAE
jgi:hypothetical protein